MGFAVLVADADVAHLITALGFEMDTSGAGRAAAPVRCSGQPHRNADAGRADAAVPVLRSGHLQQINTGVMSSASSRATTCTVRCSGAGAAGHAADVRPDGSVNAKLTCKGMRGVVPETFIDREYAYSGGTSC
ncbi:hypothetical protein JT305_10645 [Salmonella enterica subsp. enterica serovar Senftenberg]|nr:hypothetical protein [Salmonella enterica subsp. enterica serovar Senftenberg]